MGSGASVAGSNGRLMTTLDPVQRQRHMRAGLPSPHNDFDQSSAGMIATTLRAIATASVAKPKMISRLSHTYPGAVPTAAQTRRHRFRHAIGICDPMH